MGLGATNNALHTVREAWYKDIDTRDIKWTPSVHDDESRTIDKLEVAIRDLQGFLPDYDPKVTVLYATDPK